MDDCTFSKVAGSCSNFLVMGFMKNGSYYWKFKRSAKSFAKIFR